MKEQSPALQSKGMAEAPLGHSLDKSLATATRPSAYTEKDGLVLNLAPISLSHNTFQVGEHPYTDEKEYRQLRESNRATHVFRYDSRRKTILNIGLSASTPALGEPIDVLASDQLFLLGKAIQQSLFTWLSHRRTILKPARPLQCWGNRKAALLSAAIKELNLEPKAGLDVLVRHTFDTRVLQSSTEAASPFLSLLLDVHTSNEINIPVAELIEAGLNPIGRYVCRRQEPNHEEILPRLETLGRVVGLDDINLILTDVSSGGRVRASDVILEPRQENLEAIVTLYYPKASGRILQGLQRRRRPFASAQGKLDAISTMLDGVRSSVSFVFTGGVEASVGHLLREGSSHFPAAITTGRPGLLFGSQGRETGQWPDAGVQSFGPYKYMQHERNEPTIAVICESEHRGRTELLIESLRAGVSDEAWDRATRNRMKKPSNPFRGGLIGKFRLRRITFEIAEVTSPDAESYKSAIRKLLQRLPQAPDLALVQTRKAYEDQPADRNPYLAAKAAFMAASVPVQSIHIETMDVAEQNLAYVLNNLSLASYAKLGGTPFVMSTRTPASHELVIGLGCSEVGEGRFGPRSRYVGLTTVFQGDGRYLVWGQTREVEFQDYAAALLESLSTTIRFVSEQNNWQAGDRVRLIFHVYKPLKHTEMDAIKALTKALIADRHEVEFAFLDVSRHHEFLLFDSSQSGVPYYQPGGSRTLKGEGAPVRGQCRQLGARTALLQLIGPNEVKTNLQGLPRPLLLELHRDSDFTDLTYLARQVFHFSYLSWRSFFPAEEPITILYSRLIAHALGNLKLVPGWSSEPLTMGQMRNSMWFL